MLSRADRPTINPVDSLPDAVAGELRRSGYSTPGFSARYDAHRPHPPAILLDLLPFVAQVERPPLVVDLGSGTGLSTRFWAERADAVVGIEPNPELRRYAESVTGWEHVRYLGTHSAATGLPEACADIVTCAQSLQWLDFAPTFEEVARILRPGGVFAAYNYCSLVTHSPEADRAWAEVRTAVPRLRQQLDLDRDARRWPVSRDALEASGRFRFTSETSVHSVETGNADRLVGFALSEGSVTTLLEHVGEEAIGLDRLRTIAARTLGAEPAPWYLGYTVWLGVS